MVSYTIKATLNTFHITPVDQLPTIRSIKLLKLELCNMAAAIESEKTGGKYGHMYDIRHPGGGGIPLGNEHYNGHGRHATKTRRRQPKVQDRAARRSTRYRTMELENKTKMALIAYITQEEVLKGQNPIFGLDLVCTI